VTGIDLEGFRVWATGHLVENRNRGIFAEWLVGTALGVVDPLVPRREWDAADLRYRDRLIEIKSSGRGQSWPQERPSTIRFDIPKSSQPWDAETNTWVDLDPPERVASVYVFCCHDPFPATSENVADPSTWHFWVVPTSMLNTKLGNQKTVGTRTLNKLVDTVQWVNLLSTIDSAVEQCPPFSGFDR